MEFNDLALICVSEIKTGPRLKCSLLNVKFKKNPRLLSKYWLKIQKMEWANTTYFPYNNIGLRIKIFLDSFSYIKTDIIIKMNFVCKFSYYRY